MCFSIHVEKRLDRLASFFSALNSKRDFARFNDLKEKYPKEYRSAEEGGRLYPHYWGPVIISEQGNRIVKPMRYRVRPQGSEKEVPSKYNLFNARMDSLATRKTWKRLLGRKHALVPMSSFYEWVSVRGEKEQINFFPRKTAAEVSMMSVPALYDEWVEPNGERFIDSFAIITQEPNPEVEEMGHDRCPVFLKESFIDSWLNPQNLSQGQCLELLKQTEDVFYDYTFLSDQ